MSERPKTPQQWAGLLRRATCVATTAAREIGELSLPDALAFCLLLANADSPRFDRAIAHWHARFVLEAQGISADESALALVAAKGLGTSRLVMLQPRPYGDSPRRTR